MLGGDDFSSAAGAGAEEDKRDKSEEKAGHVECWIMDVGFWVGNADIGFLVINLEQVFSFPCAISELRIRVF